ncbi:hypothetical protein [Streptantibioticus ferralitis]|uniref:Secreted protein n=1 Tax=Streptantibioticus ferralitis TaxID=236510 RepID=A0ABT5ZBB4_9ACTN|nr:hypothetical protein [Streptantibioticus ferralitis]MDF2261134.1 hypothetical protein [Streptantibioticus ferralitis]
MTVPALATVLAATALTTHHQPEHHLQQHHWRAVHQTRATVSHYRRRSAPLPARLRTCRQQAEQNRITSPRSDEAVIQAHCVYTPR